MPRRRFTIPISIILFLAFTLVGTYLVRKHILEQHMLSAMEMGDVAMMRSLLSGWPCPVNAGNGFRLTPLHFASSVGDLQLVELLLSKGGDVNARDDHAMTALHVAALRGNKPLVTLLIAKGAKLDTRDNTGQTPLHMAAMTGRCDIIRLLLERGADADVASLRGETPLHRATRFGGREAVALLLRAGAQVNPRDNQGRTPLGAATAAKSDPRLKHRTPDLDEIMELLRKHGATAEAETRNARPESPGETE